LALEIVVSYDMTKFGDGTYKTKGHCYFSRSKSSRAFHEVLPPLDLYLANNMGSWIKKQKSSTITLYTNTWSQYCRYITSRDKQHYPKQNGLVRCNRNRWSDQITMFHESSLIIIIIIFKVLKIYSL